MYEEAISAFVAGARVFDPLLGHAYGRAGRSAEAMQLLRELEKRRKRDLASAADLALVHLGLDEHAEALGYLEAALDESSLAGTVLLAYLKVDPIWDPVRSGPRFTALLEKMGLGK